MERKKVIWPRLGAIFKSHPHGCIRFANMCNNPVNDLFPEPENPSDCSPEEILEFLGRYGIKNLAYDGDIGSNPGYIFRGEADWKNPLQTSLERRVRSDAQYPLDSKVLQAREKSLIQCFIEGLGGRAAGIFYPNRTHLISDVADDIFWWLSLMQHYGLSTRLVDFTRDIRIALYFAIDQVRKSNNAHTLSDDLIIYCFPCSDPKDGDNFLSNKSPIVRNGNHLIDMNRALGCLIGLHWMERHRITEAPSNQKFGWDRPYYQNPRLKSQSGMFVYPYDYPLGVTSSDSHKSWLVQNLSHKGQFHFSGINDSLSPMRIRINGTCISSLEKTLADQYGLCEETVYERGKRINLNVTR